MTDPLKVYTPYIGQNPPKWSVPQVNKPPYAWSFVEQDNSSEKLGIVFLPAFVLDSGEKDGVKPTTGLYHNDIWREHELPSENMMCSVQVTLSQEYSPGTGGDGSCIWFDKNKEKKSRIEAPGEEIPPPNLDHWPVFQHTFFPSFDPIKVYVDKDKAGKDYFYFKKDEISIVLDPEGSSEIVLDPQISPVPISWLTRDKDIDLWDGKEEDIKEHLLGLIKEGGMVILNFKKWHAFAIKDDYMEWYEADLSFNSGLKGEGVVESDGTVDPDYIWNKDNLLEYDIRKTYEGIITAKPNDISQNPGEDLLIEPCPLKMYPNNWDGTRSLDENDQGQYFEYNQNNLLEAKPLDDGTHIFFPVLDPTDHPFGGFDYLHGYVKIYKTSGVMELNLTSSRTGLGKANLISTVLTNGAKNTNPLPSGRNASYPFFPTFSLTRYNDSYYEATLKLNLNLTSDVKTLIKTAFEGRSDDPRRTSTDYTKILEDAATHGVSYFRGAPAEPKKSYRAFAFIPPGEEDGVSKHLYPNVDLPSFNQIIENEDTYIGWVTEENWNSYYFVAVFYDEDWKDDFAGEHVVTDPLFKSWCLDAMKEYNSFRDADSDFDNSNGSVFDIDELEINGNGVIETSHWKIPSYSFVSALSPKCYLKSENNPKVADKNLVISKPLAEFNLEYDKHIS